MEYLVIDLLPKPHIISEYKDSDSEIEPIIFKDKNSAFRCADKCNKGLVYPITNMIQICEKIKQLVRREKSDPERLIDELTKIMEEIV